MPIFTQTGNHDYRLYPYRFGHYGLRHCGLHNLQTRFLLQLKKRPGAALPSWRDLKSIAAKTGNHSSLSYYYGHINPCGNYAADVGGLRFVFLDTGRDWFLAALSLHPARWCNLLRAVVAGSITPASEGLWDDQIAFLREQSGAPRAALS